MSLHIVSFTTNSYPFIQQVYTRLSCITSKVPFTVYFMFKASQLLHHQKSPSSWLFIITQPDTNHSLSCLANFAWVLPSLNLCSSFAHLATLQETHLSLLRLPKQRAKQTTYTRASFSMCFRYCFVATQHLHRRPNNCGLVSFPTLSACLNGTWLGLT